MKVCYFGIYKEDFTRTRVVVKALESQGIEVVKCVDRTPSLKKYWNLAKKHQALGNYDVMLVGFPGYFVVFLARLITRKPIIFDAYISYYDGLLDRRNYSRLHPKLIMAKIIDRLAAACSRVTLTINPEYKKFFVEDLGVPDSKMEVLHKGADESLFYPRESINNLEKFTVVWWGNYIPLHGVEYIVEAASLLRDRGDIEFHLIGRGQQKRQVEERAKGLGLTNVIFSGFVPDDELIREIRDADLALGIFADSPKALRCVTNKVFEAMAMGKAIVTERSPANAEIFEHKENAYLLPPANPGALAEAVRELYEDRGLRDKLGRRALETFQSRFTEEKIGQELADIMTRHGLL